MAIGVSLFGALFAYQSLIQVLKVGGKTFCIEAVYVSISYIGMERRILCESTIDANSISINLLYRYGKNNIMCSFIL